ncbi:miraculin [Daucus carota subsp. sativus]|uniref:miraculin n=1 Tax=Daucus carota subsp. sativus TaxID=79200 RepID=UPI0007EF052C|nr:PREDICTED: miraculin-like [Daucus carota subsp. sativus]
MKPAFLIIFFLLYAFDFAAADLDPVYDPSHRKLQTGVEYYIHPFLGGSNGGGITVAATRNKTCPLDVAQDRSNFADGLGLTFHPVNIKKGMSGRVIRVSTDLVIKFSSVKGCARSGVWKVDKYDELRRRYFVTIGGAEGRGAGESFVVGLGLKKRKMITN